MATSASAGFSRCSFRQALSRSMFRQRKYRLPLLLLIPLMALLLPPLRDRLDPRARYLPGAPWTLGTALVLVFFQASLFGSHATETAAQTEAKQQQESNARIEKVRADRAAEYNRDKLQILAKVEAFLAANQPKEALAAANKYFAVNKDPDLARLQSRASLCVMKLELQNEAAVSLVCHPFHQPRFRLQFQL